MLPLSITTDYEHFISCVFFVPLQLVVCVCGHSRHHCTRAVITAPHIFLLLVFSGRLNLETNPYYMSHLSGGKIILVPVCLR